MSYGDAQQNAYAEEDVEFFDVAGGLMVFHFHYPSTNPWACISNSR